MADTVGLDTMLTLYESRKHSAVDICKHMPIADLPITMPGSHEEFDAWLRIPSGVQPRESGYVCRFQLKPQSTALLDATELDLAALRSDVEFGTEPEANLVQINLATTLATRLTTSVFSDPWTYASLNAFADIVAQLAQRLLTVEENADSTKTPDLLVYAQAMLAGLELQFPADKSFQSEVVTKLATAAERDGSAVTLAKVLTRALQNMATDASAWFGSATTSNRSQ